MLHKLQIRAARRVTNSNSNSTRVIVNLRNCETDFLAPRMKTNNGQKAFSFRGAKVWNELKHEVKLTPSLSTFKCRLKYK